MTRMLRIIYLVGLGLGITWLVATRWSEVAELVQGARISLLVAALIASFGMIVIGAWFWTTGLATLGHRAELGVVVHATSRSLLARYVPGSVWFAVGRVTLLRKAGLPGGPLTATAVLEMALSLAAVLAFGSAILGATGAFPGGTVWLVAVLVPLVVGSSPPIAGRILRWLAERRGASLTLGWSGYLRLISITMIFWSWSALTFSLYLRAFPIADPIGSLLMAGGFILAWGVGFLSIIAPQGVGVFEIALGTLFEVDDVANFAVVIGGYRLVILARDLIATAFSEFIASRSARPESVPTD